MKLSLEKLAEANFDPVPTLNTLRRWAREAKIFPAPVKHGRRPGNTTPPLIIQ